MVQTDLPPWATDTWDRNCLPQLDRGIHEKKTCVRGPIFGPISCCFSNLVCGSLLGNSPSPSRGFFLGRTTHTQTQDTRILLPRRCAVFHIERASQSLLSALQAIEASRSLLLNYQPRLFYQLFIAKQAIQELAAESLPPHQR